MIDEMITWTRLLDGRRRCELGAWQGVGRTLSEARGRLFAAIAAEGNETWSPVTRVDDAGGVWVLWRQPVGGWWYRTPDGVLVCVGPDRNESINRMFQHSSEVIPMLGSRARVEWELERESAEGNESDEIER